MTRSMKQWAKNLWKKNKYTGAVAYDYDKALEKMEKEKKGGDNKSEMTWSNKLQVIHK